ncbi:bifunctional precorrin-2 dehydrogenase/sirohydrochlorin ferrochelatase [Lewinella sp. JB7]|uniref:precorrin-2 dehydrogenase/sirohydrochlorin ferrochelatase family protein n=1 Tax=Lewinella sp. JB7 TaxID=2962887 RepID=UPI0020C94169|nr:bifunctional precorrin-2 dehydrogenase/sirohydrochlorin ferrochelatase [Lewinella sp. JB7]MCP9237879.1 bifunctional precorrin-2 dehydrogenase/sirohydrochlorin ferrochelatase [Lewinella sp. JB7]
MTNPLYPAFFRLDRLQMLVVGAGQVGEEKLSFILKSSPNARVTVVAPWMGQELRELLDGQSGEAGPQEPTSPERPANRWHTAAGGMVTWYRREFRPDDVLEADLIVAATNFRNVNHAVWEAARTHRRLCNIADTPDLCDFYLGSIVTRGPLKVAISTNGQSPTFAKRFRQWLEAELPEAETTELIEGLRLFRDRLTGDFQSKVRELNALTSGLLASARSERRCPPGGCLLATAAGDENTPLTPDENTLN